MTRKKKTLTDVQITQDAFYTNDSNDIALYINDTVGNNDRYTRTPRSSHKQNSSKTRTKDQDEWIYTTGEYETKSDDGLKKNTENVPKESLPEAPEAVQDTETRKALKGANDEIKKNSRKSWVGISIGILAIILLIIFGTR